MVLFSDIFQVPHVTWCASQTLPIYSPFEYVIETAWEMCDNNLQSICDHMSPAMDDY